MENKDLYSFSVKNIRNQNQSLKDYQGKVLLIVNVASECGFTVQYEGLEELYKKYKSEGLEILGFPCDQFGNQEPGGNEEILQFCEARFKITFPMFSKVDVNGPNTAPLFDYLKSKKPGLLGMKSIKWNFTKFLVSREGKVVKRFAPTKKPEDLTSEIEKLL